MSTILHEKSWALGEDIVNKEDKVPVLMTHTFQWEKIDNNASKQTSAVMSDGGKWGEDQETQFQKIPLTAM